MSNSPHPSFSHRKGGSWKAKDELSASFSLARSGKLTLDRIGKRRMQVVYSLRETVGRLLIACFVEKVNLDVPALHGETLHLGRLVTERVYQHTRFRLYQSCRQFRRTYFAAP